VLQSDKQDFLPVEEPNHAAHFASPQRLLSIRSLCGCFYAALSPKM